jgi:cephalosporin hydroxylase
VKQLKLKILLMYRDLYNVFFTRGKQSLEKTGLKALDEIIARANKPTDFSDHLVPLFNETLLCKPKLIVELGTRGGESTFVFERAAELCGSTLLSIDMDDCSGSCAYPKWNFVKSDDVAFAKKFKAWCRNKQLPRQVDLLFIDTSHLYEHTAQEIQAWFPLVSENGKVIFHDTNLAYFYFHADGSMDVAWDNQRGVIRALEEYFGCCWNEKFAFTDVQNGWLIRHQPHCNGFTVLDRLSNNVTRKRRG